MTLNKRYYRNIKSNLSFYISSIVLTITTLVLFFMMNIAGNAISDYSNEFFNQQNIEDANFSTYIDISDLELMQLSEKYKVDLEKEYLTDIETNGITSRIFMKTNLINLYEITAGEDIKNDNEIIISEGFAIENKIKINDKIQINDKEYIIKGFFLRPDYLYMVQNENDAYKNVSTFFLAYMTNNEFKTLENKQCRYLVKYNGVDDKELRAEINEKYILRSYLSSSNNQRITMVSIQAKLFVLLSYVVLFIAPILAIIIISLIISRKVKSEQKIIGTLTAFGIQKKKIIFHYIGFAIIPGLIGGIFTMIIAGIFSQKFGEIGLMDYEPMRIQCKLDILPALLGVLIPTCLYILAAFITVNRLVKKNTVLLLNGNAISENKKVKSLFKKTKISFKSKYAIRSLIGNWSRTFVVFLGLFLGSFIVLLGLGLVDSMKYTMKNEINDIGSYNYIYVLNELVARNEYNGEGIFMTTAENADGKIISVLGCDSTNKYLNLIDEEGNLVDLSKGYYITSSEAKLSNIKKGDVVVFHNPLTLEKFEIKIEGIIKNNMQRTLYMSLENSLQFAGMNPENILYNSFMSEKQLNIENTKLVQVIKKEDSEGQIETMIDQMDLMIYFVIILGIVICVASVYVSVNMLVSENKANISMLKVLGYNDIKINQIILSVNHILLPIAIILSIPAVYLSCDFFMGWLAEYIGMFIKSHIYPISILYAGLFTSICYFGSLFILRKKVSKISMVESLKDNRE